MKTGLIFISQNRIWTIVKGVETLLSSTYAHYSRTLWWTKEVKGYVHCI